MPSFFALYQANQKTETDADGNTKCSADTDIAHCGTNASTKCKPNRQSEAPRLNRRSGLRVLILWFLCAHRRRKKELVNATERPKSPGRDEQFSTVKTPDFATRVHFFVIQYLRLFFGFDLLHAVISVFKLARIEALSQFAEIRSK